MGRLGKVPGSSKVRDHGILARNDAGHWANRARTSRAAASAPDPVYSSPKPDSSTPLVSDVSR